MCKVLNASLRAYIDVFSIFCLRWAKILRFFWIFDILSTHTDPYYTNHGNSNRTASIIKYYRINYNIFDKNVIISQRQKAKLIRTIEYM